MKEQETHNKYMRAALALAKKARLAEESPIGCVLVHNGVIIARGYNLRQSRQDVTLHAELTAIRKACRKLSSWRLEDCDMCAGAIIQARIRHVYFGAADPKAGAVISKNHLFDLDHNHHVEYTGGILETECSEILTDFFRDLRAKKKVRPESAF